MDNRFSGNISTHLEGQDPNQFDRPGAVQLLEPSSVDVDVDVDLAYTRSHLQDVINFHEHFGFTESYAIPVSPSHISDPEIATMRVNFLQEELNEYAAALGMEYDFEDNQWVQTVTPDETSLAHALDGLVDLNYVLLGNVHLHGFANIWDTAWSRVQEANMLKVRVENQFDSKRGTTFDVRKPEGWVPPQFNDLLFY
jgi:predicted HAD superfamily Cof-like phosphohydrolase